MLGPFDQVLHPIEHQRSENLLSRPRHGMSEVVSAQHLSQSFDRQGVSTATVAKNVAAAACLFDLPVFPPRHSGTAAADHSDAVAVSKCRRKTGITIAPDC